MAASLLFFFSPAVSHDLNRNNTGSTALILPLIPVILFSSYSGFVYDREVYIMTEGYAWGRQCLFQPCWHPYNFHHKTTFTLFFVLSAKYRHHPQSSRAKQLFKGIGDNSIAALLVLFLISSVSSNYSGSEMTGACLDEVYTHLV